MLPYFHIVDMVTHMWLRLVFADPDAAGKETGDLHPLPSWSSGGQRVDISNREEFYGAM